MDNQQPKSLYELGWLVGMIEGEGWIILNRQLTKSNNYKYVPVIGMNSTSKILADEMSRIIKSMDVGVWEGFRKSKNAKWADQVVLNVRGFKRCKKLLDIIYPHLLLKKEQAKLILDYIEYRSQFTHKESCGDVENKFWEILHKLNEKGKRFNDYTPKS
jgi:hypothetical protein